MRNRLVYIGFAFLHHKDTHAGYNHIKDYIDYDKIFDCYNEKIYWQNGKKTWWHKCLRIILYKLTKCQLPLTAIRVWFYALFHKNCIFHFIYGENNYCNIMRYVNKSNKVVCTLHQPFEYFDNTLWHRRLKNMDGIILVGNSELEKFKKFNDNVTFIPHGILTNFYYPNTKVSKRHMLLTVGNWLRDYRFANNVYKELLTIDKTLEIYVVSNKDSQSLIDKHERIHCLNGISDDELRDLYCKSSILFLPLIRYTANNSLLEAAATGCNILIASDNPDNSYIPDDYIKICKLKEIDVIDNISNVISEDFNFRLAHFVENNYSWRIISVRTKDFLLSII